MIELKIKRPELLAAHSAIMIVLNNQIPSPEDAGLLMETMSHLASQDKETNKEFTLKLESKMLRPMWHSMNIVLQNDLQKDHVHATELMLIFPKISIEIDKEIQMGKAPKLRLV